ncbi:hypothetical protein HPT25_04750 [Bacillus sp. BRMEA1]|uniref:hypothetical protein n=1 Tax=Neobacillus endophyticus TaxID=2738405 RepID=UPI001563B407|nr:hypothetical protein [Neobacillus endophyticus]NRD76800.1 hypothetical protein [Neobacillus endophyticus]
MKKLLIAFALLFSLVIPGMAEAKGFSGGHSSFSHSSTRTSSYSSHSTGSTYHSGYKSASSNVSRSSSYTNTQPSKRSSFWSHAAAFGAGTFVGSMFHPFGGHYYGHSYGFSFFGFLVDLLILYIIYKVIKGIFFRRRY